MWNQRRKPNVPHFPTRIHRIGAREQELERSREPLRQSGKKKNGGISNSLDTVLKQKVLFLNLDTQHFGNGRERSGMGGDSG